MAIDRTVPKVHLRIGAELRTVGSGGVHEHVYPPTGEVQGSVPLAGVEDVDSAVRAAYEALGEWRAWRPAQRMRVLMKLAELMVADRDELARLSVLDNGMTHAMGQLMVDTMASWTSYYAGWADKIEGRVTSLPAQQRELAYTVAEPYGVVGIILTWNGPLISVGMKLIPALAAGNTVVLKPSELTPYATERVVQLAFEAGIPSGVINFILGGPETGDALVRHPLVQKGELHRRALDRAEDPRRLCRFLEARSARARRKIRERHLPGRRYRHGGDDQCLRGAGDARGSGLPFPPGCWCTMPSTTRSSTRSVPW